MRKMVKKVFATVLVLTMVLAMGTTALAAETVKINGYPNNKVGEEGITAEFQVSISNVVRKDSSIHASLGEVYVCQAPAVVTALDELSGFGVSTFIPMMDTYIEGEYLTPDGQTESWFEQEISSIPAGTKFTLTQPGLYYVYGNYGALEGGVTQVILIEGSSSTPTTPTTPPVTNDITATPTASKVLVNGAAVEFDAYTINGNNYFKLRDVAQVVSGSEKQFEVTWNGEKQAIDMVSGQPYTVVGGEMVKGDGTAKNAVLNTSTVYKDGVVVELTAYTINGNNYFKLRDLGQSFDFNVSWDGANNCIVVDTTESYTAD